ncbi:MAG: hypothetical protein ABJE47_11815 [bacterium]
MRDESAAGLLAELHEKRGRWQLTPVVALLVLAGTISLWGGLSNTGQILIVTAGAIVVGAVRQVDQIRKSTVVMYDLDTDGAQAFERLIDAVRGIGGGQRLWHVASHAAVIDRKYHAGAQEEIARTATSVGMGSAPFVKCNIDVPTVGVGKRTLWFFPDRLLVFDSGSVGAVAYANLTVARQPIRFIEAQGVPGDSRVVGRTWRYVNKSGGPDRRFKDNRELPICEYESLHLRSGNGLNELFHSSKTGVGDGIALLLHDLSRGSHT